MQSISLSQKLLSSDFSRLENSSTGLKTSLRKSGCESFTSSSTRNVVKKKQNGPRAVLDMPAGPGSADERKSLKGLAVSGVVSDIDLASYRTAEERIFGVVVKQAANKKPISSGKYQVVTPELLEEAYKRCGEVCAEYAKTFYLGKF